MVSVMIRLFGTDPRPGMEAVCAVICYLGVTDAAYPRPLFVHRTLVLITETT
jgi:hypothetical protein